MQKMKKEKTQSEVRDFIINNYHPYYGDESFLVGATERTKELNEKYEKMKLVELDRGVYDIDTETITGIDAYKAGYLDKEKEIIVGLQTDEPLKRNVNPFGGIRMVDQACTEYGYKLSDRIKDVFKYRTTHNDAVFRNYPKQIKKLRHYHILTGLADTYGRGRLLGDYRRIALFGTTELIKRKQDEFDEYTFSYGIKNNIKFDDVIRTREELALQIGALKALERLGDEYGVNLREPAKTAKEAIQAVYMGYLAAVKEQNGAAMSLGRVSTFLDIYIERDIEAGILDEMGAQELIDDFVLHLRMTRQLRTSDYNELFAGDPTWITESLGGMSNNGKPLVTKTTYRMLNTLYTLGHSPEPNLTVLWSINLPEPFKKFCAKVSIETDSIQYENDDLMRPMYGDDYGIACCVSAQEIGKDMQFFGARCNLPKILLVAINDGLEETEGARVYDSFRTKKSVVNADGFLDYDVVFKKFEHYLRLLFRDYIDAQNIIHTMHDKYDYEAIQMALMDTNLKHRYMAFGVAGLSTLVDSLSAIKYAHVKPILNDTGTIFKKYDVFGSYPMYGNDDARVDSIAVKVIDIINSILFEYQQNNLLYRNAKPTLSLLTITSNVMYGSKTGMTPDGRLAGEPFAPGANPYHNRDMSGAVSSLISVSKLPYTKCLDGISNTFSITPRTLGIEEDTKITNLVCLLDGYFSRIEDICDDETFDRIGHHLNVNVLDRDKLIDAQKHPEKYPTLTIRVSGYAVRFNSLTKKQQDEVISRTFHNSI